MQLHFQTHGSGPPLLILHGLFGSLDNWHNIALKLGETHQVFTVDLRNHGRSPHSEEFNYEVMVADLLEFLDAQGLTRTHLLGHSLGGKTAMHFALTHPGRVEKLIIVDIAPKIYPPGHIPLFEIMLSLDLNAYRERREMDRALVPKVPETALRQFLLKNVGRDDTGAFRWKLNLPVIHRNYEQLCQWPDDDRTFTGPTLFIRGGKSNYITDSDHASIHKTFPCAELVTIAKAGHWVQAEAPSDFVAAVSEFLH